MSGPSKIHRAAIVACARWENPYLAEWIGYHLALGFDHIYLHCNDDDPAPCKALLRGLPGAMAEGVTFRPFIGQGQQAAMYLDALPRATAEADWLCFLDVDEFIVLKRWETIGALIRDLGRRGVASLHFNWLFYGNNGHATRPDGCVLSNYTRRSRLVDYHTKHLSRASCFEASRLRAATFPFWHGLSDPHWSGFDRRNVLGEEAGALLARFPLAMAAYLEAEQRSADMIETAYIAHFAFKSADDFRLRVARGLGGNFGGQIKWQHAIETGQAASILAQMNEVEDLFLARRSVSGAEGRDVPIVAPLLEPA